MSTPTLKVLVAVDGSDPALRACWFAVDTLRLEGAVARLLTVLSFTLDPYTLLGEKLEDTPGRMQVVSDAVEEATRLPTKVLEEAGAKVGTIHRFGAPADEILEEINANATRAGPGGHRARDEHWIRRGAPVYG